VLVDPITDITIGGLATDGFAQDQSDAKVCFHSSSGRPLAGLTKALIKIEEASLFESPVRHY
jgi:hypothetical protein